MAGYPIDTVTSHDMCVGCGVCAGVCPSRCFEMVFNQLGEYRPFPTSGHCTGCMLCLATCPFSPSNTPDEDTLGAQLFSHHARMIQSPDLGYYLSCHVGHAADSDLRWRRTSGGLTAWFLDALLRQRRVTAVYCVVETGRSDKRFAYARLTEPHQVWESAKSAYYPVELSGVLQAIQETPEQVAIVGLPCFIKGVHKASLYLPVLRERIVFTAGLVCGQSKSAHYCDYLIRLTGQQEAEVDHVSFREKTPGIPSSRFAFVAKVSGAARAPRVLYWDQGPSHAWTHNYFKLNACNFCDDLFAELADAAFMDAWLTKYSQEAQGTSIAVVRSPFIQALVSEGVRAGELRLEPIAIEDVVRSQQGALWLKRRLLSVRLDMVRRTPDWTWVKRIPPARESRWIERWQVRSQMLLQRTSKDAFLEQLEAGSGLARFNRRMRKVHRRTRLWKTTLALASLPRRALDKAVRTLRQTRGAE